MPPLIERYAVSYNSNEMKYETYMGLRNDITNFYHCTDTSQDIKCLNNVFQAGHNLTSQGILKVTIDHYYENV